MAKQGQCFNVNLLDTVFVLAPNSVYTNWKKEIEAHSSANNYIYQHKIDKKFYPKKDKLNWYLINIEAFSHKYGTFIGNCEREK